MAGPKLFLVIGLILCVSLALVSGQRRWSATFAVALFQDWDYRYDNEPRRQTQVDIRVVSSQGRDMVLEYVAFGATWRLDLKQNHALFGKDFAYDFARSGKVYRQRTLSKDCYYIGTVTAGENEVGFASITTCNNKLIGYIITNRNDYAINPWIRKRNWNGKRSVDSHERIKRYPEYDPNFHGGKWIYPHFSPLHMPKGRQLFIKFGMSIETSYKKKFEEEISTNEDDLLIHLSLIAQNVQLWYIHPTLGYRFWITLEMISVFEEPWFPVDGQRNLGAVCQRHKAILPKALNLNGLVFLSEDLSYWNGGEGLGQVAAICGPGCVGVGKKGFQMSTLTRVITHEAGHLVGMPDAYYAPMSELCYTGLMRQGVYEDNDWGTCGLQAMENLIHSREKACLQQLPSTGSIPRMPLNVAWRAKAYQSSTYHNEKIWGAWKATDGGLSGVPYLMKNATLASCTQTLHENQPWLVIELPDVYARNTISNIHIYNREDCCGDRLSNFEVRVGNNQNFQSNPLCKYHRGTVPGGKYGMVDIRCDRSMSGKFISIQRKQAGILTVCEVNIFQDIEAPRFSFADEPCLDQFVYCTRFRRDQGDAYGRCPAGNYYTGRCPYTCGKCERYGHYKPPALRAGDTSYPTQDPKPACVDNNLYCWHWKAMGWCNEKAYTCRKSCGRC